jgi:hypothetical protein
MAYRMAQYVATHGASYFTESAGSVVGVYKVEQVVRYGGYALEHTNHF